MSKFSDFTHCGYLIKTVASGPRITFQVLFEDRRVAIVHIFENGNRFVDVLSKFDRESVFAKLDSYALAYFASEAERRVAKILAIKNNAKGKQ